MMTLRSIMLPIIQFRKLLSINTIKSHLQTDFTLHSIQNPKYSCKDEEEKNGWTVSQDDDQFQSIHKRP